MTMAPAWLSNLESVRICARRLVDGVDLSDHIVGMALLDWLDAGTPMEAGLGLPCSHTWRAAAAAHQRDQALAALAAMLMPVMSVYQAAKSIEGAMNRHTRPACLAAPLHQRFDLAIARLDAAGCPRSTRSLRRLLSGLAKIGNALANETIFDPNQRS